MLVPIDNQQAERIAAEPEEINLGDWYWFKHQGEREEFGDHPEILCCVFHVGSNYVLIKHPDVESSWHWRVHLNEWSERCRLEPSPQTWFDQWAQQEKREIKRVNAEIRDICTRLGVDPTGKRLTDGASSGGGLAVVSGASDTSQYKAALIKAKEESLPALFKEIKEHSAQLTRWLKASSLTMKAQCGEMSDAIKVIEQRIGTVGIYAGLSEEVALIRDGAPAGMGEKLRMMQGKLFMDEECLLNYSHGGMEFKNIGQFDEWLARADNFSRILPFPRCLVAFQVRRYTKEREQDGTLRTAWINFELGKLDELTFLYIRNGERLYRLDTEIEFEDQIFPARDEFDFSGPMMVSNGGGHATMTVREYEQRTGEYLQKRRQYKRDRREWKRQREAFKLWQEQNPEADRDESGFASGVTHGYGPYWSHNFDPRDWKPLDDLNVYLDDVNDRIRDQANHYNMISCLIQGLLDRSDTLHPHPPVKLWTIQGFEGFIELIYDKDRALHAGAEPPSWEEYKAACNAKIDVGSVVTGQEDIWYASLPREISTGHRYYTYIPNRYTEGNPGPGKIAVVKQWSKRSRLITFRWKQRRWIYRRSRWDRDGEREFDRSIKVAADKLFNISGYAPGDYKQFFDDPRSRRNYLQWADLLLTAEEYHAGNLMPDTFERIKPERAEDDEEEIEDEEPE